MARKGWELMADGLWHRTGKRAGDGVTFLIDHVLYAISYTLFSQRDTRATVFFLPGRWPDRPLRRVTAEDLVGRNGLEQSHHDDSIIGSWVHNILDFPTARS